MDDFTKWLPQEDVMFHHLRVFHSQRVEALIAGSAPLSMRDDGILIVHLVPQESLAGRSRFTASELKAHGGTVFALGERGGQSRFNADGVMSYSGAKSVHAFSQLCRDGRLEAAMSDVCYKQDGFIGLRTAICEQGLFRLVGSYLEFCKDIGVKSPVWFFAALAQCVGAKVATHQRWIDHSDNAVDRSPAYLPEIKIASFDVNPVQLLRPVCDAIWQTAGVERSPNFDDEGKWHEPR
jgi:hypothetical protein